MNIVTKLHAPTFSLVRMLSLTDFLNGMKNIGFSWHTERSTRAALRALTERELRDIGLTRADVTALDTTARWAKRNPSRILDRY